MFGKRHLLPEKKALLVEEVVSALQKDVRRGDQQAWYWASALLQQGHWKATFNRLMIIASEDVGLGSPYLPIALWKEFVRGKSFLKGKKLTESKDLQGCKDTLHTSIQLLIAAPKSRALNNLLIMSRKDVASQVPFDLPSPLQILHPQDPYANGLLNGLSAALHEKNPRKSLVCVLGMELYGDMIGYPVGSDGKAMDKKAEMFKYIWSILKVHAAQSGDAVQQTVQALWEFFKVKPNTLFIAHTICLLSGKLSDVIPVNLEETKVPEYTSDLKVEEFDWSQERHLPDYALDKHTARGKKIGRGIQHFRTVGALVVNEAFKDPFEEEAFTWYEEIEKNCRNKGEEFKGAKSTKIMDALKLRKWLPFFGAVDITHTSKKKRVTKRKIEEVEVKDDSEDSMETDDVVSPNKRQKILPYSESSAKPTQTWEPISLPEFKTVNLLGYPDYFGFYDYIVYKSTMLITDALSDIVDTQLPCGNKPRTLLAKYRNIAGIFVKGPISEYSAKAQLLVESVKSKVGFGTLRDIGCAVWKDSTGWYVLMPDMVGMDSAKYPFTLKSCKRYPELKVLDGKLVSFKPLSVWLDQNNSNLASLSKKGQKELLGVLLFRRWMGISDTNFRNICINSFQSIFSVDETRVGWDPHPCKLFSQSIKAAHATVITQWLYQDHKDYVTNLFSQWKNGGLFLERLERVENLFLAQELKP